MRERAFRYDAARQLTDRFDAAGQAVHYRRDSGGRVTEMVTPDGTSTFAYSPTGRMLRAENSEGIVEFGYDAGGRLVAESCNGATVTSRYDAMGRRIARLTPTGVESVWTYDDEHRPTGLTMPGGALDFAYDDNGREIVRRLGETARLRQDWDPAGRLSAQDIISASHGRTLQERRFTYRPDGYPTEIVEQPGGTHRFTLDPVGRITGVDGGPRGEQPAVTVKGSRVVRSGRVHYTYDEQGRVTTKTRVLLSGGRLRWQFRWDAEDRLRSVTGPDGRVAEYAYDALGRRTSKRLVRSDGTTADTIRFVWDGEVLAEQVRVPAGENGSGDAAITWEYLLGEGARPVAQVHRRRGAADVSKQAGLSQDDVDRLFLAIVNDLAGAPTDMVGPDGDIVWRRGGTPWAPEATPEAPEATPEDGVDCPLRSPGRYRDDETGLDYNYHRYFDPETGRFLSPDPLGLAPGPDDYADVVNPTVLADPLGLSPCSSIINVFRGPSQGLPGGQLGAPISIRQLRMALGRADMSVSRYDIVHVPEIHTPTGLAFGNSPHSVAGLPELGPRGLPLIQISDIGLRSMDEGVATVFHEIYHHEQFRLSLNSKPLWGETVATSHIWGGTEDAAEEYGQRMLAVFKSRTG